MGGSLGSKEKEKFSMGEGEGDGGNGVGRWRVEERGVRRRDGGLQAVAAASCHWMLFCDSFASAADVEKRTLLALATCPCIVIHAYL